MIQLSDILLLTPSIDFKVHFARWNGVAQPLDVLARSMEEWRDWQQYYPGRNEFNRRYVFSLAQDYRNTGQWMFGGVWEVMGLNETGYEMHLTDIGRGYIKRLVLGSEYNGRTTRTNLENHYEGFEVLEILSESYFGQPFPGYDCVRIGFSELETIVQNQPQDWSTALAHMKGVYVICDTHTGSLYVGSAYGDDGIWSRWSDYAINGHGGNVELRRIVKVNSLDYCRKNFRFALLEAISSKQPDATVIAREEHWKQVLDTRGKLGLNRN